MRDRAAKDEETLRIVGALVVAGLLVGLSLLLLAVVDLVQGIDVKSPAFLPWLAGGAFIALVSWLLARGRSRAHR